MSDLTIKEISEMLCDPELELTDEEVEELFEKKRQLVLSAELPIKEIEAMSKKPGRDRYIYTLKRVADLERAWTLKDEEGLVGTEDDEGIFYFYIWPYKEYAQRCMIDEWED